MCTAVRNKRFLNIDRNVHLLKKMTEVRDPHKSNIFSSKLICKKLKLASKLCIGLVQLVLLNVLIQVPHIKQKKLKIIKTAIKSKNGSQEMSFS